MTKNMLLKCHFKIPCNCWENCQKS